MEEQDELLALIGQRVTQRRASLGLTLDQVAALSDVSRAPGIAHRARRGARQRGRTRQAVRRARHHSFRAFTRETRTPLLRRGDQPVWRDPSSLYVRREVAPARSGSPVRIVEIEFPPGAEVTFAHYPDRISEQHVWLLDGELEIADIRRQLSHTLDGGRLPAHAGRRRQRLPQPGFDTSTLSTLSSSGRRRRDGTPHPRPDF